MANLKEYLHFYLGRQCRRTDTNAILHLIGIDDRGLNQHPDDKCVRFESSTQPGQVIEMKWSAVEISIRPILRQMSKITSDEESEISQIGYFRVPGEMPTWYKHAEKMKAEANVTKYLLEKGFDVFGLIEMRLAVPSEE